MELKNVLILDDAKFLAVLIKDCLKRGGIDADLSIECFEDERNFKAYLDACCSQETLVMVNATFKPVNKAARHEFLGVRRIIKQGLRISWLRLDPVIYYATLSEDDIRRMNAGNTFLSDEHHQYCDVRQILYADMSALLNSVSPIPSLMTLKYFLYKSCSSELADHYRSIEHQPLSKIYKLDSEAGRRQLLICLEHLKTILLDDSTIDPILVQSAIEQLKSFSPSRRSYIRSDLENIRDGLLSVSRSLRS